MYELKKANKCDKDKIKEWKSQLINIQDNGKKGYKKVHSDINKKYKKYLMILLGEIVIGMLLVENNQINEIYIDEGYRNRGIGSIIIKDIINNYKETYIWVFKTNRLAIDLYKKLGFKIIRETTYSYYMRVGKYEFN